MKDINGKTIEIGQSVRWHDPQDKYKDLSRVWEVFNLSEENEIVHIKDEYGEAEVLPSEIEVIETLIKYGKKITKQLFAPDWFDDGLTSGFIYKDEDAFRNRPDDVCYIPEAYFDNADKVTINGEVYYAVNEGGCYTRKKLEKLLEFKDVDLDIEDFFFGLQWACPETYLEEIDY